MEREYSESRIAEIEKGRQEVQKLKVAMQDQMVIAEK
jgi:hypothetical protein